MDALEGLASTFSEQEKQEAVEIDNRIATISRTILSEKQSIESNFVRLSQLIEEVRRKKYWLIGKYKTFGDYIENCEKKYGIKHSQLYVGMKIARNLLPTLPEQDLVDMGITRAGMLSKYVEQSGQSTVPEDVLQVAKDPSKTAEDLEETVNRKLHNILPEIKDKWFNLGGFYASQDEKQEILEALEVARGIDPVVSTALPEWQQQKELYLRLCREFRSSYV